MSDLLKRIEANYLGDGLRSVEVVEWGETIFFRPLTLLEKQRTMKGVDPTDDATIGARMLIMKALDKDGQPLFQDDAPTQAVLQGKASFPVIAKILAAMQEETSPSAAKND
jgi:hypothetical protein